jgi:TolB-like protein/DNA-binding winged helix-turn-helix (wHTH) protein/Tfp pilus assembly protein PilF
MNDSNGRPRPLRFGVFEVDLRTGELRKQGLKVKLHGQPFQVLAMLLERPGELVTRKEIREKLWPGDTFIDFEHSINTAVKCLREAFGDDTEHPTYIETLPRRGYRLIAPVEALKASSSPLGGGWPREEGAGGDGVAAGSPAPADVETRGVTPGKALPRPYKPVALGAGITILALVAVFTFNVASVRDRTLHAVGAVREPPPGIRSIAVLPLENLSRDPEQEYFADGMTEELITNLGKISALRVISRTSVLRYKGTKKPLPEIAKELNVDAIVEGTVLRSGNRVRVTANLLHAATDRHLWGETYERDLRDVLSLQDELARAITKEIQIKVTPQEQADLASAPAVNPEAYRLYLQGRYEANKRTVPAFAKSALLFQQALEKDPGYSLAYAGLAETYGLLPFYGGASPQAAFFKAKAAALKALELDRSLAEGHAALGFVLFYGEWDWAAAERELKYAIELNPGYVNSHHWYGEYLSAMGRHDQAIAEIKRAQDLDPLSPLLLAIGGEVCILARRYDEAIEQSRRALELDSNYALAQQNLASSFLGKQMYEAAAAEYTIADQAWGKSNSSGLALAYALTGKRGEALKILRRLTEPSSRLELDSLMAATLYLALDEKQEALDWLEKAYQEHEPYAPFWNVSPVLDPLRSDPRFQHILSRMNFPNQRSTLTPAPSIDSEKIAPR